jgi:hypothetical protein
MIQERLAAIQRELKAPKGQFNAFGKYKYRSCEDILEAVKPLLGDATLVLSDSLEMIGDRYYIKASAILRENGEEQRATAWAREEADRKGMDAAQITGAVSSYARKYALNGLFLIDDTKDADTMDNTKKAEPKPHPRTPDPPPEPPISANAETLPLDETPPAKLATAGQLKQIGIIYSKKGITDRDKRISDMRDFTGRPIESGKDLSFEEAHAFIEANIAG